jgi:hypothetical protein
MISGYGLWRFYATFNDILAISWRSVSLVEETRNFPQIGVFEFLSWPLDYISVMTKLEHFPSVAISLIPYLSRKLKLKSLPTLTINYLIPLFKQAC